MTVGRFMNNPCRAHWNVVKHVFRCMVRTKDLGILFSPNNNSDVVGYIDSEFVSCVDSRKSTTGYCFKFGNGAMSWKLKLQDTSMTEAEYVAAFDAAKEALWLGRLMRIFRQANPNSVLVLYNDS